MLGMRPGHCSRLVNPARALPTAVAPTLLLDGASLTLEDLEAVARTRRPVALAPAAREAVVRARRVVDDAVARNAVVYGVNTGFGNFADVRDPARPARASCS